MADSESKGDVSEQLSKGLARRQSAVMLQNQGILHGEMSGHALAAQALEKNMTKARLSNTLTSRPDVEELKEQGILQDAQSARAAELERRMNRDALSRGLQARPDVAELKDAGVYRDQQTDKKEHLERSMRSDGVRRRLSERPNLADLQAKGIIPTEE